MIFIKKLKRRVILIFLASVIGVFALAVFVISWSLSKTYDYRADTTIDMIEQNNGVIPKLQDTHSLGGDILSFDFYEESEFKTRYFVVYLNADDSIAYVDTNHIAATSENDAKTMAEQALYSGNSSGYVGNYRYRITSVKNMQSIIFLDCKEDITDKTLIVGIMIAVFSCIALLIIVIFILFSSRVLKPFEINAQKQKQFITDASHELKTPLAIISANAEVLSYKNGQNKWMDNILSQIERMTNLINGLIVLSKMEELDGVVEKEAVNISDIVQNTAKSFEENLEKKSVQLSTECEDITVNGNREQLEKLFSILIENAVKYVSENGEIKIKLCRSGRHANFTVFNTAEIDKDLNCDNLFERFYRTDSSRSSDTGGYGIGLSIAREVTILHKGSISAKREDNGIKFTAKIAL